MDIEEGPKRDKSSQKEAPLTTKQKVFYLLLALASVVSLVLYNPYFVYFSSIHWIVSLSLIVIGAFTSYLIYYKDLLPLRTNIFYVVNGVILLSMVLGNLIDSSTKEVKLTNTDYYKASGSSKISVSGSIKNTGTFPVKRCQLSVTVRAGSDPNKARTLKSEDLFTPSTGFNFDFKTSVFDFDRYWSKTVSTQILQNSLPATSIAYFSKQLDFKKSVPFPIVRFHLSCK